MSQQIFRKVFGASFTKGAAPRTYDAIMSTPAPDRDRDRLPLGGWIFGPSVALLYAHDHQGLPIGRVRGIRIAGAAFRGTLEFPPEGVYDFADTVVRLIDTHFLTDVSVGFRVIDRPTPNEFGGVDFVGEKELLELSVVPIAANADARIERMVAAAKWFGEGPARDESVLELADDDEVVLEIEDEQAPARNVNDDVVAALRDMQARARMDPATRAGLIDVEPHAVATMVGEMVPRLLREALRDDVIREAVRRGFAESRGRLD